MCSIISISSIAQAQQQSKETRKKLQQKQKAKT